MPIISYFPILQGVGTGADLGLSPGVRADFQKKIENIVHFFFKSNKLKI